MTPRVGDIIVWHIRASCHGCRGTGDSGCPCGDTDVIIDIVSQPWGWTCRASGGGGGWYSIDVFSDREVRESDLYTIHQMGPVRLHDAK